MKASNLRVKVNDQIVGILLYADDVVLLGEHEEDLQVMNTVAELCWTWRLVNQGKTQIVHFRHRSLIRGSVVFNLGSIVPPYTDQYKHLGLMSDEHMTEAVGVLAQSAGRALGSVVNEVKHLRNLGFMSIEFIIHVCVRCLTMPLVFGGFRNIQVVILCVPEPFCPS